MEEKKLKEHWLNNCYLGSVWDNVEGSPRPNSPVGTEYINKVKLREITNTSMILEGSSVYTILHERSSMRKPCSMWVPHWFTFSLKSPRINRLCDVG